MGTKQPGKNELNFIAWEVFSQGFNQQHKWMLDARGLADTQNYPAFSAYLEKCSNLFETSAQNFLEGMKLIEQSQSNATVESNISTAQTENRLSL